MNRGTLIFLSFSFVWDGTKLQFVAVMRTNVQVHVLEVRTVSVALSVSVSLSLSLYSIELLVRWLHLSSPARNTKEVPFPFILLPDENLIFQLIRAATRIHTYQPDW